MAVQVNLSFLSQLFLIVILIQTITSTRAEQSELSQLPLIPSTSLSSGETVATPTMEIQAWKGAEKFRLVITGLENHPVEISRLGEDPELKITCVAPYPLMVNTNILAKVWASASFI